MVGTFESIGKAAAAAGCHGSTLRKYMSDDKPFNGYRYRYPCKETLPGEVWKVCKAAPLYEVSNLGRVRIWSTGKQMREFVVNGWHTVNLVVGAKSKKTFVVSRLVATEFVSLP